MSVTAKSLGIEALPVADRLALVEEIWASICAETAAFPWTAEQRIELAKREAEDDLNPSDTASAEEVFSSVKDRLANRS